MKWNGIEKSINDSSKQNINDKTGDSLIFTSTLVVMIIILVLVFIYAIYTNITSELSDIKYAEPSSPIVFEKLQSDTILSKSIPNKMQSSERRMDDLDHVSFESIKLGVNFPGETIPESFKNNQKFAGKVWSTHFQDPSKKNTIYDTFVGYFNIPIQYFQFATTENVKRKRPKGMRVISSACLKSSLTKDIKIPDHVPSETVQVPSVQCHDQLSDIVLGSSTWNQVGILSGKVANLLNIKVAEDNTAEKLLVTDSQKQQHQRQQPVNSAHILSHGDEELPISPEYLQTFQSTSIRAPVPQPSVASQQSLKILQEQHIDKYI